MFFSGQFIIEGHGMEKKTFFKKLTGNMGDGVVSNSTKLRPHKESYKEHSLHLPTV